PRNRRSTASRLRWRDIRPPRPKPTPPEAVVCVFIVTLLRITSALKSVSANRGAQQFGPVSAVERPSPATGSGLEKEALQEHRRQHTKQYRDHEHEPAGESPLALTFAFLWIRRAFTVVRL